MMGKADGFPYPSLTGDELEAMGFDRDGRRASTDKQIYDAYQEKVVQEVAIIAKRIVSAALARITEEINVQEDRNPSSQAARALFVVREAIGRVSDELEDEVREQSQEKT